MEKTKITDFFKVYKIKTGSGLSQPLVTETVRAGFPSPADDHIDLHLDLNEHLIKHPEATFFVRAAGDSMIDAGINEGDLLIVDKALDPKHNDIVVAVLYGEFTLKRLVIKEDKIFLQPENPKYPIVEIHDNDDFYIWGVVTYVISKK